MSFFCRPLKAQPRFFAASCALLALVALSAAGCVGAAGTPTTSPTSGVVPPSIVRPPASVSLASGPLGWPSGGPSIAVPPELGGPTPAAAPSSVSLSADGALSEADRGKTVSVAVGATVKVVLHNTYWKSFASTDTAVLALAGEPVVSGAGLVCIPGSGCGTVTATFTAVSAGTARITAARTTCGEALQCTGDDASYEVTILVR